MLDLNTLIPLNPSVQVVDVRNINNRGEIDGTGVLSNGDTHTLLLIPCDDDHQNVKGCDYSMVDTAEVANNAVAPRSQAIPPTMDSLERRINPFQNWCVWTAPAKSHGRLLIGIT